MGKWTVFLIWIVNNSQNQKYIHVQNFRILEWK